MSSPPPYEPPSGQSSFGQSSFGSGYPPPTYPGQPHSYGRPSPRNGLAITSLVLGILALLTCWLTFPGIILGILAVIFGGIGIARGRADRVSNKGMAIAGLITGVLGAAVGAVLLIIALRISADCQEQYGPELTQQQLERCIQDNVGT